MALSAPVPMPATTLARNSTTKLGDAAATMLATQYSTSALTITARRPILSPRIPAPSAPNRSTFQCVAIPASVIVERCTQ